MQLGYIGLGKMGHNMVERLLEYGHKVVVHDKNQEAVEALIDLGAKKADSSKEMVGKLSAPRLVWVMVPHDAVDAVLEDLLTYMEPGDTIVDGGNSFYKHSVRRAAKAKEQGVHYLDVGVSGGPGGARRGACMMIGGEFEVYEKYQKLFDDLTVDDGFGYMGKSGAGHFVKMVHNGIEYGMMQAIAEGFTIMKEKKELEIDLVKVADVYNHGSVIESRLIEWLKEGYETYGEELEKASGTVGHTGEGEWTANEAKELSVLAPAISDAFEFRVASEKSPSYTGKILSTLRNMFGGHSIE